MIKKRYVTSSGNILLFTSDDLSEAIAAAQKENDARNCLREQALLGRKIIYYVA